LDPPPDVTFSHSLPLHPVSLTPLQLIPAVPRCDTPFIEKYIAALSF